MTKTPWIYASLLVLLACGAAGCPKSESHTGDECDADAGADCDGGSSTQNSHGNSDGNGGGNAADGGDEPEVKPDVDAGPAPECVSKPIKKADLLFVIDNSSSMREEQQAVREQIPKLVRALTSGERMPGDPDPFPPVEDLHVGVVSTDMGVIGVTGIAGCSGFGDDGVMRDPSVASCAGAKSGQRFLSYKPGGSQTPDEFADGFACLADLGTDGCGFEQQLEASLKALWPKIDVDPITGQVNNPNRISFLKDPSGAGETGHGDQENLGFFRNDGETVLGVVVVTDEEDCSSRDTRHFTPSHFLQPTDPLYMQDLNLRCFYNKQNLYDVRRYVNGLKALSPGAEDLVVFAAIAGVPVSLVTAGEDVDFSNEAARNAYYDEILGDSAMQEKPDPSRPPGNGDLMPSCENATTRAYPPRRLVEVARGFGENGLVQSICQNDFTPAFSAFIEKLSDRLTSSCARP